MKLRINESDNNIKLKDYPLLSTSAVKNLNGSIIYSPDEIPEEWLNLPIIDKYFDDDWRKRILIVDVPKYNAKSNFNTIENPDRIASNWFGHKVGNVDINDYMRFEKGEDAHLEYMTAKEYMECCSKIFGKSVDYLYDNLPDKSSVDKYAKDMLNGDVFPLPYVNFATNQQEGRHRALAVAKAYGEDAELPVIVIYPSDPTDAEIRKYAENRWGKNEVEWGFKYCLSKINPERYDELYNTEQETDLDNDEDFDIEIDDLDNIDELIADLDLDIDLDNEQEDDTVEDFLNKAFGENHKDFEDYSIGEILNGLKHTYE